MLDSLHLVVNGRLSALRKHAKRMILSEPGLCRNEGLGTGVLFCMQSVDRKR
jgi:hypothetical protein